MCSDNQILVHHYVPWLCLRISKTSIKDKNLRFFEKSLFFIIDKMESVWAEASKQGRV